MSGYRRKTPAERRAEATLRKAESTRRAAQQFADEHSPKIEEDYRNASEASARASARAEATMDAAMGAFDSLDDPDLDAEADAITKQAMEEAAFADLPSVPTHDPSKPRSRKPSIASAPSSGSDGKKVGTLRSDPDLDAELEAIMREAEENERRKPQTLTEARDKAAALEKESKTESKIEMDKAASEAEKLAADMKKEAPTSQKRTWGQFFAQMWNNFKSSLGFGGGEKSSEDRIVASGTDILNAAEGMIKASEQQRTAQREAANAALATQRAEERKTQNETGALKRTEAEKERAERRVAAKESSDAAKTMRQREKDAKAAQREAARAALATQRAAAKLIREAERIKKDLASKRIAMIQKRKEHLERLRKLQQIAKIVTRTPGTPGIGAPIGGSRTIKKSKGGPGIT